MDVGELHRRAVEGWQAKLDAVKAVQWSGATPCADWDVRALVNHVVGEELWTRPIAEGRTIAEVGDKFDGDVLGEDPGDVGRKASADAAVVVDERLPEGGTVHLSFGDFPIEEYAWQLTTDHLIHSWDLAAATGQDRTLDPELVTAVAGWYANVEDVYREGGAVGPRVESEGGAQADLLAAFGRSASW